MASTPSPVLTVKRPAASSTAQPYNAEAPAHWSLSANLDTETQGPAAGEIPGPPCLPWWIVRKLSP